ncbi:BRO1-domain-containing protein [Auriculariales sp. MPI-PUGE-AT-0066]|nr:BRO1-domain-containing protein [Auriculariales sp. MPI-PUGE-AT-0066]
MAQSPTIAVPRKSTEEVDWTGPVRQLISQSYGENPDNYAAECQALQRCRQDAVRGAGSDTTGRDLLYKYFGQLELLELRFAELRVAFPWRDAFTNKLTTQNSIAFEKASIIFQIAATHSAIANSQNRCDPEGLKRAFYYLRTTAGMLTYINDNFLHAPSTDLSRDVVKFLVGVMIAQAHEVFYEKCVDEKKGSALVSKVAAQTAALYTTLNEDVKEFMGKGIFDRNWVTLIQIKSKYFASLAQYHRSLADVTAGKHGDALARLGVAESLAKEANRSASSFSPYFVTTLSTTLPADAGTAILQLTKTHLALCTEKKAEGQRDNDLIYNAIVPSEATLSVIDKLVVATPIPIQDVYGTPEVQKTIGTDIFIKLVPLSVHESASVYSEEKAKLVRTEVEKGDLADVELKTAIDSLGVKSGLGRFRDMAEDVSGAERDQVPSDVKGWRNEIAQSEEKEPIPTALAELGRLKDACARELDAAVRDLDNDNRECEQMRVKYDHLWTQEPAGGFAKGFRQDLKSHRATIEAAASSDGQIIKLWESVRADIALLLSPQLGEMFKSSSIAAGGASLLDIDNSPDDEDREDRQRIGKMVDDIEEKLSKLSKISRERKEVLKDLKEKVQTDDVSHLLLLNRRNAGVEPSLFATQLEKFRPLQARLAATVHYQETTLQELAVAWKGLKDIAGKAAGARKYEELEKRKLEYTRRFRRARERWTEVREGLIKGFQFYQQLSEILTQIRREVTQFVNKRSAERSTLVNEAETKKRLMPAAAPSERQPASASSLADNMSRLSMGTSSPAQWNTQAPAPPPNTSASYGSPVPPPRPPPPPSAQLTPPPPPPVHAPQQQHNPYDFGNAGAFGSQFSVSNPQPPPPPSHYAAPPASSPYGSASPPPPPGHYTSTSPPPPLSHTSYGHHHTSSQSQAFPPPPAPVRQSSFPPPPQQHQYQSMSPTYGQPAQSPFPPPPAPYQYGQPQQQYGQQPPPM